MSIYYDLYENPDKEGTEEQKLLHARVVPSGTSVSYTHLTLPTT